MTPPRTAGPSSAPRNCSAPARSASRRTPATRPRGCSRRTPPPGWTASAMPSTPGSAGARTTPARGPARPVPWYSTSGKRCISTTDCRSLLELAEAAARLGVERYVLDDGWFRGRRNDQAGLGDWYVDEDLWPAGLTPLIDAVTGHGMEFGLWVEPEMVNEDSDLARAHPDWIAGPARSARRGRPGRPADWPAAHAMAAPAGPGPGQSGGLAVHLRQARCPVERDTGSVTSSGTRTGTWPRWAMPAARPCTPRRRPFTGSSTNSARPTPASRSKVAPPGAPAWISASWNAPTGSGPRTATMPWNGRPSSAGPAWWCRRSSSDRTSAPPRATPPRERTTSRSGRSPRCSATSASNGTSGISPTAERDRACRGHRAVQAVPAAPAQRAHGAGRRARSGPPAARRRVPRRRRGPLRPGVRGDVVRRSPGAGLPAGTAARTPRTGWKRSTRRPMTGGRSCRRRHRRGLRAASRPSGRFLAESGLPMPVLNPEHGLLLAVRRVTAAAPAADPAANSAHPVRNS